MLHARLSQGERFWDTNDSLAEAITASTVESAKNEALAALRRPELATMTGYEWVLVTWIDAEHRNPSASRS